SSPAANGSYMAMVPAVPVESRSCTSVEPMAPAAPITATFLSVRYTSVLPGRINRRDAEDAENTRTSVSSNGWRPALRSLLQRCGSSLSPIQHASADAVLEDGHVEVDDETDLP